MSKKSTKAVAKKSVAKKVSTKATKKPNLLHEKLVKLFCRPNGATLTDTKEAGFECPAMAALKIAERRELKTSVVKKKGELTRYLARAMTAQIFSFRRRETIIQQLRAAEFFWLSNRKRTARLVPTSWR
jgi:hypothetical protein